jgi:hypothetical protein
LQSGRGAPSAHESEGVSERPTIIFERPLSDLGEFLEVGKKKSRQMPSHECLDGADQVGELYGRPDAQTRATASLSSPSSP